MLERYHARAAAIAALAELLGLLEAGWRRGGFGDSEEERQLRAKADAALRRYHERFRDEDGRAGLVRARVLVPARPAPAARPRRPRRPPARRRLRADRLQDRPPEDRRAAARGRAARRSTRSRAREAWQLESSQQAYYYVLDDEKVPVPSATTSDRDWITETVLEVADGILGAGLRADAVLRGVLDVRLPDRLPGGRAARGRRGCDRSSGRRPRWRRKRWNSRASTSPEGRSRRVGASASSSAALLEPLDERLHVGVALRRRATTWRS